MTPLKKLTILILLLLLIAITLLFFKFYLWPLFLMIAICCLSYKWHLLLTEELIVYHLMRNVPKVGINAINKDFGKKSIKAISGLIKKGIVEKIDDFIVLKVDSYKFSMTKWRPPKK